MSTLQQVAKLLSYVRRLWPLMLFSTVMRVTTQSLSVALLGLIGLGLVRVIAGTFNWAFVALLAGIGLAKAVSRYAEQVSGHSVAFNILETMRNDVYASLVPKAPAIFGRERSGDIVARLAGDIERVEVFFAHTIAPVVTATVVTLGTAAVLSSIAGWQTAGVYSGFMILIGALLPIVATRATAGPSRALRTEAGTLTADVVDTIDGLREVVAFAKPARQRIVERSRMLGRTAGRLYRRLGLFDAAVEISVGLMLVAVALAAIDSPAGAAMIPVVLGLSAGSLSSALGVGRLVTDIGQTMAAAGRIFALIDAPQPYGTRADSGTGGSRTRASAEAHSSVTLENVWFRYSPDGPSVLRGLSCVIDRNTVIVGSSGSGKSTIALLAAGFYVPEAGTIRASVTLVEQEPFLFHATVRWNLLLADPQADDRRLWDALEQAELADYVRSLPEGLDADVGARGEKFSGGQRQRLGIARALLTPAQTIIFDEPSSNLDRETGRAIETLILERIPDRTVILITHSARAARKADHVIVLESGTVAEAGAPSDLRARGGAFERLFAADMEERTNDIYA